VLNVSVLLFRCIDYREFVDIVRDPDAKLEDLDKESESDEMSKSDGSSILELGSIQPKGHDQLKELRERQQIEQKHIEEEEMEREREFEQKIRRELIEEEEAFDRAQEGGPNPKMIGVRLPSSPPSSHPPLTSRRHTPWLIYPLLVFTGRLH
jgi:hypothetical protein